MKYNEALKELQDIVAELEADNTDIEILTKKLARAKTLIKLCKDRLTKTDMEIRKMLED